MAKVFSLDLDKDRAVATVSRCSRTERRERRLELGRRTRLSDLSDDQAHFFYGECLVFSQAAEEIAEWMDEHFFKEGGSDNYLALRELYDFYLALTADVDIRYDIETSDGGQFRIEDCSICGNDYYIPF